MHAQSKFSLKCTMVAMVPECGMNSFFLGLRLVISHIEDNLDERDQRIRFWSLRHYSFSTLSDALSVSDFPWDSGTDQSTSLGLGSAMDNCHRCNNCSILVSSEGEGRGFASVRGM